MLVCYIYTGNDFLNTSGSANLIQLTNDISSSVSITGSNILYINENVEKQYKDNSYYIYFDSPLSIEEKSNLDYLIYINTATGSDST